MRLPQADLPLLRTGKLRLLSYMLASVAIPAELCALPDVAHHRDGTEQNERSAQIDRGIAAAGEAPHPEVAITTMG